MIKFIKERRTNRIAKAALAFFALAACCCGEEIPKRPVKSVRLQLKWTHAFQFAGYYMAEHRGYYRDAGLHVEIIEGGPNLDVTEQVLSGQADFGVGTTGLLLDFAEGRPVKVLGVVYQHSPLGLIMRTDKPTATIQDLIGTTIMVDSRAADLYAMLKREGLPMHTIAYASHTGRAEDLVTLGAKAVFAYITNEPYTLSKMGVEYIVLSPRAYGIDYYGDNYFTSQAFFEKNRGVALAFREATNRGWQDAFDHPEAAVDLILEKYPGRMTREHLLFEASRTVDLMTGLVSPGYMLLSRWQHIVDTYREIGMLDQQPDLNAFLYLDTAVSLPVWVKELLLAVALLVLAVSTLTLYQRNRVLALKQEVARREESAQKLALWEAEKRLALQQFIVRDIHDGMGGIAANLVLTATLARREDAVLKKDDWIEKLERLAAQLNTEVRDLMNSLDERTMRWGDIIDSIRRAAELLFDPQRTSVVFAVTDVPADEELGIVEGMSLSRLIREGMNNVVKHAHASSVEIAIAFSDERVSLSITDNGEGFVPETVRRGRGLNNLAQRTAELGGTFEIISDRGTQLKIAIARPVRIVETERSNGEGVRA